MHDAAVVVQHSRKRAWVTLGWDKTGAISQIQTTASGRRPIQLNTANTRIRSSPCEMLLRIASSVFDASTPTGRMDLAVLVLVSSNMESSQGSGKKNQQRSKSGDETTHKVTRREQAAPVSARVKDACQDSVKKHKNHTFGEAQMKTEKALETLAILYARFEHVNGDLGESTRSLIKSLRSCRTPWRMPNKHRGCWR